MPRVSLKASEVLIGKPLRWDLYDPNGTLLFAKGYLIENEADKAALMKRRAMRDMEERPADLTVIEGSSGKTNIDESQGRQEVRMALEETRAQPGDAMQLQGSAENDRFVVRLIGYLKGRSIITSNPVKDGAPVYLREGETFVVRTFSGKLACAFTCTVTANPMKPYPHVHLSYPTEVRGLSVRRTERVKLRSIVAIDLDHGIRGAGVLVDMSIGGAMMMSRMPELASGQTITIKFKLAVADMEYLMDIRARIRSSRPSEEETDLGLCHGLQFLDVSAEDNLVLASCVFQQLAENRLS